MWGNGELVRCDSRIDDSLNLHGRSSSNVGNGPTSFLPDSILRRGQQAKQSWEGARRDDNLGLEIITGDNVTDRSKSRGLDRGRVVPMERLAPFPIFQRQATHMRRSTKRLQTPLSMTAWILSLEPSERYEMAQQASIKTSSSIE